MGKIENGIGGGFSGKVGNVVGMKWRGIAVIRSLPRKNTRPPSDKQLEQRLRFGCVTRFLTPVCPLLQLYFGNPETMRSRRNLAISYHVKEAISGNYPNIEIDYSKVVLTMGHLPGVQQPLLEAKPNAAFEVNWTDNSQQVLAKATDKLLVVWYNEAKNSFHISHEALRADMQLRVNLDSQWSGDTVHCWIAFTAAVGSKCSTSSYVGGFVVV